MKIAIPVTGCRPDNYMAALAALGAEPVQVTEPVSAAPFRQAECGLRTGHWSGTDRSRSGGCVPEGIAG